MAPSTPAAGGATIVVVDDEPDVRDLMVEIVASQGHRVLTAASTDEALAVVERSGPVDLVIADVFIPGAPIRELRDQLRRLRPGVRILYVSGHDDTEIVRQTGASAAALLRKPFSVSMFLSKVRDALAASPDLS
jgi:DNA-binding NtrC family response regulator